MSEWLPIDSAPKDGTDVLLWARDLCWTGKMVVAAWITRDIEHWHVNDGKHGPFPLRGPSPTHWMPLPAPPPPETSPNPSQEKEKL